MKQVNSSKAAAVAILITVCLVAPMAGREVAAEDGHGGSYTASQDTAPIDSKLALYPGDRLRITLFETFGAATGGSPGEAASAALRTSFQRMDLSGEYVVDEAGMISLPRLGVLQAENTGTQELQAALTAAFEKAVGRPVDVNVAIVERAPVYVVGAVRNPGAYKFVPNMTVLHAVALAGGIERGTGNVSELIQGVQEMERMRKSNDDLKRLIARRTRLEAQRDGVELRPSAQLVELAGEQVTGLLLANEISTMRAENAKTEREEISIDRSILTARKELEVLKRKCAQLDIQRDLRTERLQNLENLVARGLTTRHGIITIRSELADLEARRQEYQLAVVQGETRLSQAEMARKWFNDDNETSIAKAITATDIEIAEARQTLKSAEMFAYILTQSETNAAQTRSAVVPEFEIVRKGEHKPVADTASEISTLRPGDVLKIRANRGQSSTKETSW
jgi:polysaccharide biosynthesis/export protein ExoF